MSHTLKILAVAAVAATPFAALAEGSSGTADSLYLSSPHAQSQENALQPGDFVSASDRYDADNSSLVTGSVNVNPTGESRPGYYVDGVTGDVWVNGELTVLGQQR